MAAGTKFNGPHWSQDSRNSIRLPLKTENIFSDCIMAHEKTEQSLSIFIVCKLAIEADSVLELKHNF